VYETHISYLYLRVPLKVILATTLDEWWDHHLNTIWVEFGFTLSSYFRHAFLDCVGDVHHFRRFLNTRQHTSAYVSIRQHTTAYVNIRQHTPRTSASTASRILSMSEVLNILAKTCRHTSACVSIRQHTSAYVSIRQLLNILAEPCVCVCRERERERERPVQRPLPQRAAASS
jgi:hypothetical protein